ncbi:hypothetical protein DXG01_002382 [Tephrocybe rancida]|nr:hypothetical protein DXG01_002382 [Tephrocybe rancida]
MFTTRSKHNINAQLGIKTQEVPNKCINSRHLLCDGTELSIADLPTVLIPTCLRPSPLACRDPTAVAVYNALKRPTDPSKFSLSVPKDSLTRKLLLASLGRKFHLVFLNVYWLTDFKSMNTERTSPPKLPVAIEKLVIQARQHPDVHVKTLENYLRQDYNLEWSTHPDIIIELLIAQFSSPPPLISLVTADMAPIYALIGIWRVLQEMSSDYSRRVILPSWPHMWPWIDIIYRGVVTSKGLSTSLDSDTRSWLLTAMVGIPHLLLYDPDIAVVIINTPGILTLAAHIYVDLGMRTPEQRDLEIGLWAIAGMTMTMLLRAPTAQISNIIDAVGLNHRSAAQRLFGPFSACIAGGKPWIPYAPFTLEVHSALCIIFPSYYCSLPPKLVMSNICRALAFFATFPASLTIINVMHFEASHSIALLLSILRHYASHIADGHAWVIYGLQFNLLPLLIRSAEYSKEIPAISVNAGLLLNHIKMYAVHRPVMRYVLRDGRLKGHPNTTNDAMLSTWNSFLQGMTYINALYHNFECSAKEGLRRCSRCRDFLASPKALAFFSYLVAHEMKSQKQELNKEVDRLRLHSHIGPAEGPPYMLKVDCVHQLPPILDLMTKAGQLEQKIEFGDTFEGKRMPVLVPVIWVRYGSGLPKTLFVATEISGDLFGWMPRK